MKILYINSHSADYVQDLTYSGLVKLFGLKNVIDYKWNQKYLIPYKKYPKNLGYLSGSFLTSLINLGGKQFNIVFVGSVDTLSVANDRFKGYKKALKEFGAPFNPDLRIEVDYAIEEERLKKKIWDFIKSGQKFDSFICAGGYIAYYTGMVLLEAGYSIPDDLLLGEFGDNSIVHRLGVPFVTVDQFPSKIGEKAFDIIDVKIEGLSCFEYNQHACKRGCVDYSFDSAFFVK